MPSLRACVIAALVSCASFVTPAPLLAQQDSVIDIGTLGSGSSFLWAVNNRNQAVGWSEISGTDTEHPILWQDGRLIDLGALPDFPVGRALGINDRGDVVGYAIEFDLHHSRAILWHGGTLVDITPAGVANCTATGINNRGDIAGHCPQAVLWRGGQLIELGLLPGQASSYAFAINEAGVIVGMQADRLGRQSIPYRWADGVMTPLALPAGAIGGSAQAINARGTIVGYVQTAAGGLEPAIWQGDTVAPLAGTWGAFSGVAWGINDRGDVVGQAFGGTGGFVWANGTFTSLPSPLIGSANDINDRGVAVGRIAVVSDIEHGAVWPKTLTRVPPSLRGDR